MENKILVCFVENIDFSEMLSFSVMDEIVIVGGGPAEDMTSG